MLDRLGGGAWQAKKAKLKERIRQIESKALSKMGTILTDMVEDPRDIVGA